MTINYFDKTINIYGEVAAISIGDKGAVLGGRPKSPLHHLIDFI